MSNTARLRKIESAARYYYEHFLQDEAEDMECCFSEDQHFAAKALRDALSACTRPQS